MTRATLRDNGFMHEPILSATTFPSMDVSTPEQWQQIGIETARNQPRVAESILSLMSCLEDITDGFAVNQLEHSLQTATRAELAGADIEMVVASLCHDIGKVISVANHPAIAAEILRPYVRDEVYKVILTHQDFQGRHYYHHFGLDPDLRRHYKEAPWFELAQKFADEWDQTSFDPEFKAEPLKHFEPMVREVFAQPQKVFFSQSETA